MVTETPDTTALTAAWAGGGSVMVTGPPGSGKSTLVSAFLQTLTDVEAHVWSFSAWPDGAAWLEDVLSPGRPGGGSFGAADRVLDTMDHSLVLVLDGLERLDRVTAYFLRRWTGRLLVTCCDIVPGLNAESVIRMPSRPQPERSVPIDVDILQVLAARTRPSSAELIARILRRQVTDIQNSLDWLWEQGWVECFGLRWWWVRPSVRSTRRSSVYVHARLAACFDTATPSGLEQRIYHLGQADDAPGAWHIFEQADGVDKVSLTWAEHVCAERMVSSLMTALSQPLWTFSPHRLYGLPAPSEFDMALRNVWTLALRDCPVLASTPRRLWLARLHNSMAVVLDCLGEPTRTAYHYRQALRLGLSESAAFVLSNYVENLLVRDRLRAAETVALRLRRTGHSIGAMWLWYLRTLRGVPAVRAYDEGDDMGAILERDLLLRTEPKPSLGLEQLVGIGAAMALAIAPGRPAGVGSLTAGDEWIRFGRDRGGLHLIVRALRACGIAFDVEQTLQLARERGLRLLETELLGLERPVRYQQPEVQSGPPEYWPCTLAVPEFPLSDRPLPGELMVPWGQGLPPLLVLGLPGPMDEAELERRWRSATNDYTRAALAVAAGPSQLARDLVDALQVEFVLKASLKAVIEPETHHLERLLDERRQVHRRLRAAGWWQVAAISQARGDFERAHYALLQCGEFANLSPPNPVACTLKVEGLVAQLEDWRQAHGAYPSSLSALVPRWMMLEPACRTGPCYYRVARTGLRCVTGCRQHGRLYDSTLGSIGRFRVGALPRPVGFALQHVITRLVHEGLSSK